MLRIKKNLFSKNGPIHLLLFWACCCPFGLHYIALADFTSSDSQNLDIIRSAVNVSIKQDTRLTSQYLFRSVGSNGALWDFFDGSGLVTVDGIGDSSATYANYLTGDLISNSSVPGPNKQYSMLQYLNMIAEQLGTTYYGDYISPSSRINLMQAILGWDHMGYSVKTNGVLGRMQSIQTMMHSNNVATANFRTNLLDKLDDVKHLLQEQVWLQTNQIYLSAWPFGSGWNSVNAGHSVSDFVQYWKTKGQLPDTTMTGWNQGNWFLPYYLLYVDYDNEPDDAFFEAYFNIADRINEFSDITPLKRRFQETYGNLRKYESIEPEEELSYNIADSQNIYSNEYKIVGKTNEWSLISRLDIPELDVFFDDYSDIQGDYEDSKGPTAQVLEKFKGYVENTFNSQGSGDATYTIEFHFSNGESTTDVEIQEANLMLTDTEMRRFKDILNLIVSYVITLSKCVLVLLLSYRSATSVLAMLEGNPIN